MTTIFRLTPQITSVIDNTGDSNSVIPFLGNTSDTTPLLQGTAAANSMVYIYAHQRFIGMVESDNSGNWEYTPTLPLSYGGQAFSVMSQGQMSDPFVVIVQPLVVLPVNPEPTPSPDPVVIPEPVSPAKPAIAISHIQNQNSEQSAVAEGGKTDGNTVRISGTAQPHATVQIYANGREIAMINADAEGKWHFEPTLTTGDNLLKIASRGQWSEAFNIDVQPAAAPVSPLEPAPLPEPVAPPAPKPTLAISGIQNQNSEQSAVAEGGTTEGNSVRISGTAQPHATVQIYANGREIAMINADAEGKWHFEPTLTTGDNLLKIASRGQWSEAFNIDVQPATTLIPEPEPTAPETPLPESGVILTLKAFDLLGTADFINNGDTTNNRKPILSGQAEPLSVVIIYSNDRVIGEAHTDSAGFWDYSPVLNDGENILRVALADGLQSSADFTLNVDAPISGILTIDQLYSPDGIILPGGFATTDSVVVSGTAEPFTTVELYLNGGFYGRADVAFNGKWGMPASFPDSDITLRIKVSNEFSDSFDFHKQQTPSMPSHEESGMMQLNELTTQGLTLNALLINDNEMLFKPEEQSTQLDTILNLDILALTEETVVEFSSATFAMPVKVTSEYIEDQNISSLY